MTFLILRTKYLLVQSVVDINTLSTVACFILFIMGLGFLYYLFRILSYNEASELRAKRRIEDVAYYMSKLEEQIEDAEGQLHKKIDASEMETRISLTLYDKTMGKAIQEKSVRAKARVVRR